MDQVRNPSGLPIGRILLLLGDSGSGKTHLMRAFRNQVHSRHEGYCGYLQMTTFTEEYSRYVLNNLIESLDHPYYEPESRTSGLMRVSNSLVDSLGDRPGDVLDEIREGEVDQAVIDRFVDQMANSFICDRRFHSVDVYLVQALLYLQSSDPRIKARVLKYLRCEDLTPQDRGFLGGMVPCTYADAPDRVLQRFGELMWILEKVPLVLCVDQLEDMFDMKDAPARFRRSIATLCALTGKLPSAIVVISCLSDYYSKVRESLTRPMTDRIEDRRGPISLKEARETDEVLRLISSRLKYLYEAAGVASREDDPTYPIPMDAIRRMAGMRTRDVLNACQRYREECVAERRILPFVDGAGPRSEPLDQTIEQAWNDFRSSFSTVVPVDEMELAGLLARTIRDCTQEAEKGHAFEVDVDGRFIEVECHAEHGVDRILVGVCNKAPQGGHLGKQVEDLMQRAGEHTAVVVRSTAYPKNPKAAVSLLIAKLITGGGRRVVVEDSDWRTMLAFAAFRKARGADQGFHAWQKETRPLTSLSSIRTILDLDRPGPGKPARKVEPPGPTVDSPTETVPRAPTGASPTEPNRSVEASSPRGSTPLAPLAVGTTRDRRTEPVTLDPAELTRHAAFLGAPGSGKTTLALGLVEQLLLQGVPAILVDRKGDLCSYAQRGMGLRDDLDGPLAGRAGRLRRAVEVAMYTPRRPDGRPLSIAAAPAGLGSLPDHERAQAARFAGAALAGMMNYGAGRAHQGCLGILNKAIDLLCRESPESPVGVGALITFVADKDPGLVNEVGRLDVRLFDKLVQDLEALRLNHGDLLEASGEALEIEALFGLGRHARPGKTRLSIISTKFLGNNQDVQFWVAQFLMEVGRWISRAPAPDGMLQAVLMFDEADLYLPASSKPASKEPMENLLRRARSAGLGLLLATQNPGDFDYRCRDNIRAWFVGQVRTQTALAKLEPMLTECRIDVASRLPSQTTGQFYLIRDGQAVGLQADRSAVETRQMAEDEIPSLARSSLELRA